MSEEWTQERTSVLVSVDKETDDRCYFHCTTEWSAKLAVDAHNASISDYDDLLCWIWNTAGESLRPFEAGGPINSDNTITTIIWHCHGCDGELVTHWKPYQPWVKPNEENFEHGKDCMFLKVKALVESAFEGSDQRPFHEFYESAE